MYLCNENFTRHSEQIMHIEPSLSLTLLITIHKLFKNSIKLDINSIINSVDPDQLASVQDSHHFRYMTL